MSRKSEKCALKINRLATIDMDQKVGAVVPLSVGWGSWDPIQHNVAWTEAYLRTKWYPDPFSRLATTDMRQKVGFGGCCIAFRGGGSCVPI